MNNETRYALILEWLYTHDKAFGDHVKWRQAFIEKLKEVLL